MNQRRLIAFVLSVVLVGGAGLPMVARGQTPPTVDDLATRVARLETQVAVLSGATPSVAPPTPASIPGRNQLINVVDALQAQGLTVKSASGGASADAFTPPGQGLTVNDKTVYVFVYATPDDRAIESDGLDPSTIDITTLSGTVAPPAQVTVFSKSNVIAVLLDGDAALSAKIAAGMETLP